MGDFGSKYYKIRPAKDNGNDPATKEKFNRQQDNIDIINNEVDEIILQENIKVIDESGAHGILNLR